MSENNTIIIVSGLPRSGTSMMMQMLQTGGIALLIDDKRPADEYNPQGYFEYEKVKSLHEDNSWVTGCKGKAVKILFHQLKFLPGHLTYKMIFMQRDLNKVLNSQDRMLTGFGKPVQNRNKIKMIFEKELQQTHKWLKNQINMDIIYMDYEFVLTDPLKSAKKILKFLGCTGDERKMRSIIKTGTIVHKVA
jgi:Sulfotransferase domain